MENIWDFTLALKINWVLQEYSKPVKGFLNFVLVCKENSPRYDNPKTRFSSHLLLPGDVLWKTYHEMF